MKRKPGRPPLDPHDRLIAVTIRLAPRQLETLESRAQRLRHSLSAELRRLLIPPSEYFGTHK